MFASVSALAYLLSNSLAIENYIGCFFALPIVISSMRWGLTAGRKTMVATAVLLLTLGGPVKASTYLLMHGFLGFTMGSLWRMQTSWGLSIAVCSLVRALGAVGFVLITSFLIRENILALITINMHATFSFMCASVGISAPTMNTIYVTFGVLLMMNCGILVLLLHILYGIFLTKLGMKDSLRLPRWLEKAV
ncbi:unnamed protein product [Spirodela intermedia]|nr:unnamed protein product [Spirodela intermedia]CAA6670659.1 unnamed protein product [Spirodela intermedia]